VLVVADPSRSAELASALDHGAFEVAVTTGGDDTIDLFAARSPGVVVVTATLELGDAKSLIETIRRMAPRAEIAVVVVGDDDGPIRTALDAFELAPDRFLARPLAANALRFAVAGCLEAVALVRRASATTSVPPARAPAPGPAPVPAPIARDRDPEVIAPPAPIVAAVPLPVEDDPTAATRAKLRARWEALADSIGDSGSDEDALDAARVVDSDEVAPLPPPIVIQPRRRSHSAEVAPPHAWQPGTTDPLRERVETAPVREPTIILSDGEPAERPSSPPSDVAVIERRGDDSWSEPVVLPALVDGGRDSKRELSSLLEDEIDRVDPIVDLPRDTLPTPMLHAHDDDRSTPEPAPVGEDTPPPVDADAPNDGRDFARQLRAKMSMMAQRLFQRDSSSAPAVEVGPHHDHSTEIDLASLGEEPALGGGVTELESRAPRPDPRELTTSPGSWDTQVRERGLPDAGEIVRGVSDAPMVLAKLFAQSSTGRACFYRDDVEKVVFFDQGRPVFVSSNEPGDRMGELLVREGKITAAQYERCQSHVAQSGRRMGEILVDFGYLKRRELLPAVRRHVEDILYSLFSWDRGHYRIAIDPMPCAERIRLSRHPASLVLEGVRRKLDRGVLERLVGGPSTVIEVGDRKRLGGIINAADLSSEERAALAAFDGQSDVAQIARGAGIDMADVLPLAWGLCVLGLATARRADDGALDESTALVGETDLAIDRERVRARWALVTESDYFALLGVRRDATTFEIRRAYQAARRDFAADCFPTDLRRELARELDDIASVLDEAFRVLRDDRLRVQYLTNLFET
jgi:ActR/RegA family two-component response regulator